MVISRAHTDVVSVEKRGRISLSLYMFVYVDTLTDARRVNELVRVLLSVEI